MYLPRAGGFWAVAGLLTVILLGGGPARAQNALCPTSIPTSPPQLGLGITFKGSSCTNGPTGAYSDAALASQSLGEIASQDATDTVMGSIFQRRAVEQRPCPEGLEFVNGTCIPMTIVSR